ncbi:hypothetical protein Tco_1191112 [Tanacetum coccineum]
MLDMIPDGAYRAELEVETIINKMREGRLRWFGHVRRRPQSAPSAPVRRVEALVVDGMRRRGFACEWFACLVSFLLFLLPFLVCCLGLLARLLLLSAGWASALCKIACLALMFFIFSVPLCAFALLLSVCLIICYPYLLALFLLCLLLCSYACSELFMSCICGLCLLFVVPLMVLRVWGDCQGGKIKRLVGCGFRLGLGKRWVG